MAFAARVLNLEYMGVTQPAGDLVTSRVLVSKGYQAINFNLLMLTPLKQRVMETHVFQSFNARGKVRSSPTLPRSMCASHCLAACGHSCYVRLSKPGSALHTCHLFQLRMGGCSKWTDVHIHMQTYLHTYVST